MLPGPSRGMNLPTAFGRAAAHAPTSSAAAKRGRGSVFDVDEDDDDDSHDDDDFIPLSIGGGGRGRGRGRGGRGGKDAFVSKAAAAAAAAAGRGRGGKKGRGGGGLWGDGGAAKKAEEQHDAEAEEEQDLDPAERARRARRAGRFGSGAADGVVVHAAAAAKKKKRRRTDGSFGGEYSDDEGDAATFGGGSSSYGVGIVAGRRRAALDALSLASASGADAEAAWDGLVVRGTATALEKSYFRLTAPPDPSTVRPAPVLSRALARLVAVVAGSKEEDASNGVQHQQRSYFYASDQLKGVRQDCTVQRLRGPLAAAVYEAHARAALEYGDPAEFNQCQAQLELLHAEIEKGGGEAGGLGGGGGAKTRDAKKKKKGDEASPPSSSSSSAPPPWPFDPSVIDEFLAYRILYQAAHGMSSVGERMALTRTLARLAEREKKEEEEGATTTTTKSKKKTKSGGAAAVEHALRVRAAISDRDFCAFFRLYSSAPRLGRLLMDVAAPAMRFYGLNAIVKAVKPAAPVPLLARTLGFLATAAAGDEEEEEEEPEKTPSPLPGCSSAECPGACRPAWEEEEGCAAAAAWLAAHGAVLVAASSSAQDPSSSTSAAPAAAAAAPSQLAVDCKASTGKLFVPEDTEAVAHGDANLAIDDFLSRAMGV